MATKKKYNLLAAIAAMDEGRTVEGLEAEASREMERQCRRKADHGGIMIPDGALCREMGIVGLRDVTSTEGQETFGTPAHGTLDGIGGWGAAAIATDTRLDLFIDALTARTVFGKIGVQILDGLVGDLAVPVGGAIESDWLTVEGGEAEKKNPELKQCVATPHTLATYTEITRKLMVQTSDAAQGIVVGILQNAMARAVEKAGIKGTGSNGQPCGVENTTGVQTVTGITPGAVTKADLIKFWSKMETENANTEAAAWIMSPAVKGLLAGTIDYTALKNGEGAEATIAAAVSAGRYLFANGMVEDFRAFASNLCDPTKLYFGDWSQLMLCAWRGTEIVVDKYSHSTTGATRVVAFNDCDFVVRQPKAFVIGTAMSAD